MADMILFEGIKKAVLKGESLRDAMISFYNAGYEKVEIEKAARAVQMFQQGKVIIPEKPSNAKVVQKTSPQQKPLSKTTPDNLQNMKHIQRVSNYGNNEESIKKIRQGINSAIDQLNKIEFPNGKPTHTIPSTLNQKEEISTYGEKPKKRTGIIILVVIMLLLLGILAGVFIFKEQILDFFDRSSFFSGLLDF